MTKPFFKLHAAALAALLCAAGTAQAKTWVLSTGETNATYRNAVYDAFAAASGGAANVVDGRAQLAAGNNTPLALPADVDVIAVGVLGPHEPARVDEVLALLANPPRDLTVVFFSDGAAANNTAPKPLSSGEIANKKILDAMNVQLGLGGGEALGINYVGLGGRYYLNTNSPFAQGFPESLGGGDYDAYTNVPGAYALYMAGNNGNTKPAMPGATDKVEAYGLFAPRAATQNQKTCVFAFGDISPFSGGAASPQITGLTQRIMHMATDPNGACQSKTVATPDLVPTVTPLSLSMGAAGAVQVQVSNNGLTPNINGQIVIDLPAGLEVPASATLPPGCTRNSAARVTCTVPIIPNGTPLSLPIPVQATAITAPGVQISAAISGNTGELAPQQVNNTTMAPVAVTAAPAPVAVPTLDIWGLGALAALLGTAGLHRQRPGKRNG
ncbi:MAG: IPTL-CTERM sorting domain-containing protein [Comamonadaceae bacterium]|nr:IPTL-CTERM sorting domain-containing protein [Comamonadaceae bacterium]